MAIFGLSADYFEHLSLETHPKRTYTSASNESSQPSGISGSVYVFAERSKFEKEAQPLLAFDDDANAMFGDDTVEGYRQQLIVSASELEPVQIQQVTELTFSTEDTSSKLGAGYGTAGAFDYRMLLGHSTYEYSKSAYFDLSESWGATRRFYFYNSNRVPEPAKPPTPEGGTIHMIDLKDLSGIGDPGLPPEDYNVSGALEMVASATVEAINKLSTFEATYSAEDEWSNVEITNVQYGSCEPPVTGALLHPITGRLLMDDDLDGDGIGDQVLPTFPYQIFGIEVITSGAATTINSMLDKYTSMVNESEASSRKQTAVQITRFEPSFKLTSDTLRKNVIKDVLFPHYRTKHDALHWGFTNYNTINFFTSSEVPSDSALIYPSFTDETVDPSIIPYSPSGSFTFEFYINPRYTIDEVDSYASSSFSITNWEDLFIDFYGGGRGATDAADWADDNKWEFPGYNEWRPAEVWGYTGYHDGFNNNVASDDPSATPWTESQWALAYGAIYKGPNVITDKGDEAPDYDFRTGDPVIKSIKIILNDDSGAGPDEFVFTAPRDISNATDWTIAKNDIGDYDNYATAVNIADVINSHERWDSWAEKLEVPDEDGQQKVDKNEEPLWTDDNGLNEYTWRDAVAKDEVADINSYQKTSDGHLVWSNDAGATETTAAAYGYPVQDMDVDDNLLWTNDDLATITIASDQGYTGFEEDGATEQTEFAWAEQNGFEPVYETGLPLPDNQSLDVDEIEYMTTIGYAAVLEQYAVDPLNPTDDELTSWEQGQSYERVITYDCTKAIGIVNVRTLVPGFEGNSGTIQIETTRQEYFEWHEWREVRQWTKGLSTTSAYTSGYTGFHNGLSVNVPGYAPTAVSWTEEEWSIANGYADAGTMEWEWILNVQIDDVDEDARDAFGDREANALEWNYDGSSYSTGYDDGTWKPLNLEGGRDHVVIDREKSHPFHAGTILHMSSSYAVSIVTGSNIDIAGHPDTFRIMLQLSSSADIPPSEIPLYDPSSPATLLENGEYGEGGKWNYVADGFNPSHSDLIFISSDNSLKRNHWHHVAIRWGTELIDDGKAQILIDGSVDTEVDVLLLDADSGERNVYWSGLPQEFGDLSPRVWPEHLDADGDIVPAGDDLVIEADPHALFIGNYFEGFNGSTYKQTGIFLDADGNPTLEDEAVSEKYAWYIQEKDESEGDITRCGYWLSSAGITLKASEIAGAPADSELRSKYFIALYHDEVDDLEYKPVLSSTLGFNVADLQDQFGPDYVYNEVLSIDSDNTAYIQGFFSYEASEQHGVTWGRVDDVDSESGWTKDDPDPLEPYGYLLRHPLNAEIHEIKIWSEYRTIPQIGMSMLSGSADMEDTLRFYLPPHFVKETREREVLLTPFQSMKTTTDDPFNVALSFGVGGHLLNLENFCRDFVTGEYPLLMNLTGSTIDVTAQEPREANEYLFATGSIRKRNLTILPNDNGKFIPNFSILATGSFRMKPYDDEPASKFTNDFNSLDYSLVSLRGLVSLDSLYPGLIAVDDSGEDNVAGDSILADVAGSSPENPGVAPGSVLTIFQRTRDNSSNQVVFFDVSNLFYGKKINPGSFEMKDVDVTGSGGKVKLTFRDNGKGTLYRADADSPHPLWSSAGNIIYEEGIAVLHTPCVPHFGKEQFEVNLEGQHNLHIMEIFVPCNAGAVNSSSNPNFQPLSASLFASDTESDFVYVTGLNFHDENLNIVARTNLAQPVIKRDQDDIMFRVKVDF